MEIFKEKDIARFWSHVDRKSDQECWVWTASKNSGGYGVIEINNKTRQAHIIAYLIMLGPYPEGLQLDHLCRNRACVNPAHLEPVTCKINILRGDTGKHQREKTHCPKGHEYTYENTLLYSRKDGGLKRVCRECHKARCYAAMARLRARKAKR